MNFANFLTLALGICTGGGGDRCPLDLTTFYIVAGIPLVKDIATLNSIQSLQCLSQNFCGDGKLRENCPTITDQEPETDYRTVLNLAVIKSRIPPGSILAQVKFGGDKTAGVKIRYAKYGQNATLPPTDVPPGWDDIDKVQDLDLVFPNATFSRIQTQVQKPVNETESGNLQEIEAIQHGAWIAEWFKLILGATGVKGTVTGVRVMKDEVDVTGWTVFVDELILTFAKDWNRDVFEDRVQKFNAEHFSLCGCLLKDRKMGNDTECRKQERYQKYLPFFDTESSICTKI